MTILKTLSSGGIAQLSNGTQWRVAPSDLKKAQSWMLECSVYIEEKAQSGAVWTTKWYLLIRPNT